MHRESIHKGVVLAAGDGDRLGFLTVACPKVLLGIRNRPLISYPIEAMAAAGISEILIVVGYLGDEVIKALGSGRDFGVTLKYISNPEYVAGNTTSVYKARDWARGSPVVLCMGDHLMEKTFVARLLGSQPSADTLCVDYKPGQHHNVGEATKVKVNKYGHIEDIGKGIALWNALDTGLFFLTETFFEATGKLLGRGRTDIETADVIRFLVSEGCQFHTCDVTRCFWMDVDTEEDLNLARSM